MIIKVLTIAFVLVLIIHFVRKDIDRNEAYKEDKTIEGSEEEHF